MPETILIIEDDKAMGFFLKEALEKHGYDLVDFPDAESALDWLEKGECDLILSDVRLPGMSGLEALPLIRERTGSPIIIMTAFGTKAVALEAVQKGAYDYLTKPLKLEELEIIIRRGLEKRRLETELATLKQQEMAAKRFPNLVGQSRAMREIQFQILKVAPTDSTVLITGESGTGKELVAGHIHENSNRADKPLVKLNCAAIPEGLLESELFGHEKGAFTGASFAKPGKFEIAHTGSIFLDEVGDMSLMTQAKLLRVLQERELQRVGGTKTVKIDVRFIVATNKELPEVVKTGDFREDLYYRLNVFHIHMPPLRERREDIPGLVEHFLAKGPRPISISPRALDLLLMYSWPGNARELENTIERALVIAEDVLKPGHLPPEITEGQVDRLELEGWEDMSIDEKLMEIEKSIITKTLIDAHGKQKKAAELLGIKERSLWHRIKKFNIDVSAIKNSKK